jgi:hypothetical protein
MSNVGLLLPHWFNHHLKMRKLQLISTLAALLIGFPSQVYAQWITKGRDAIYNMYLPQAKKADTNAMIIVSYDKRWSCKPAVSVMLVSGRQLGTPEKQTTVKKTADQLILIVDGRRFTDTTQLTIYSNGMELAMFAPQGLVDALSQKPKSVIAKIGEGLGGFDFSDGTGFQSANAAAAANCS